MTILIITSSYPALYRESFEGAFIEALAEALTLEGCRVHIVTQCTGASAYNDPPDVRVHRFPWLGAGRPLSGLTLSRDTGKIFSYFWTGYDQLNRLAMTEPIDVTLCAWTLPSGLFGWHLKRRYGIPYLTWSLGSDIWKYAPHLVTRRLLGAIFDHALINYADGYDLIAQIKTISNAPISFLSSTRCLPPAKPRETTRVEGRTHFLFVGRYHPNKGPDILLEAIKLLTARTRENMFFHFFGSGDMHAQLQTEVHTQALTDCVKINGPLSAPDLSAELEIADYLIIPSRRDSIPVVLSDALQKECSLIVSRVGDMGRVVSEYSAGYIAISESPADLARVIELAHVEQNRHRPGMASLYSLFDIKENAARLLNDIEVASSQPPLAQTTV